MWADGALRIGARARQFSGRNSGGNSMSTVTQRSEVLFASPLVTLMRINCRTPRSGLTETYETQRAWIGLPLSGVFTIVSGGEEQPIHAAVGVVFPHALEYRMRHPCEGGD